MDDTIMKEGFNMRKISSKIMLSTTLLIAVISIVLSIVGIMTASRLSNARLAQLEEQMYEDYDLMIMSEVNVITSQIQGILDLVTKGELTEEQAKYIAATMISSARYGTDKKGYFWIDDYDGNNVVMFNAEVMNGDSRLAIRDEQGQAIISDMIAIAQSGGGYYDYYFKKPDGDVALPKRGYVQPIESFQWVVGTGNYTDDIASYIDEQRAIAADETNQDILIYIGLSFVAILVGSGVALYIGKRLASPIIKTTELINITADLNIAENSQYDYLLKSKDETGKMAKAMGKLRVTLREIVKTIQDDTDILETSAESLQQVANEGMNGTQAVSDSSEEFAKGATEQAKDTESASMNVFQLAEQIDYTVTSSQNLREATELVDEKGKTGGLVVSDLDKQFEKTATILNNLSGNVDELTIKSSSIDEITATIQSIANQTNLLALNAAIEAARAGEAGKGFAVVADEIRKLAEETSKSTTKITDLIGEILTVIQVTKENMDNTSDSLQVSENMMSQVKVAFTAIENSMSQAMNELNAIDSSISHVNSSKDTVTAAIEGISAVTEENAASAEEISATMETQVGLMENILESVEDINHISTRLNDLANQFNT